MEVALAAAVLLAYAAVRWIVGVWRRGQEAALRDAAWRAGYDDALADCRDALERYNPCHDRVRDWIDARRSR